MKNIREITKNGARAFAVCECIPDQEPLDGTDADDEERGEEGGEAVAFPGVAGVGYSDLFEGERVSFGGGIFWGGRYGGNDGPAEYCADENE